MTPTHTDGAVCTVVDRRSRADAGRVDDVVVLEGVSRQFGAGRAAVLALDDASLRVRRGEFVAVMGATGSGKSTLLNCAAALERPTSGVVRLVGRDIGRLGEGARTRVRRDHVGFVFQSYNLLSELTVAQNVLLPQRLGAPAARTVVDVLDDVGLAGMERRPVGELSGGEHQRVAIARALSTNPTVLFADEPTGALDPTTGGQVLDLLRDAVDRHGMTVLMVTHDPSAASWSDRLVLLRSGRIIDDRPTPDAATIAERLRAASTAPGAALAGR
jgi:putative ABC transport system ATP-binding protein